jgi:aminoglycoside 3-N-acetyltransferase
VSSAQPRIASTLAAELTALGLVPGQDLLVHCSLRQAGLGADGGALGTGGAAQLLDALRLAAGPDMTLVVPAQTAGNSLSSPAFLAATAGLSTIERDDFIAAMPGFDPASTPSAGMGAFAEHVRTRPGAVRSGHPQSSFAALGPRAADAMARHDVDCHLGERSPLRWLYQAGAAILLIGVGYATCTAFHLAEYRLPGQPAVREYRCFTAGHGSRTEHIFTDIDLDDSDFCSLGAEVDRQPFVRRGRVGKADCRWLPIRAAVDFAVAWQPFLQRRRKTAARDYAAGG